MEFRGRCVRTRTETASSSSPGWRRSRPRRCPRRRSTTRPSGWGGARAVPTPAPCLGGLERREGDPDSGLLLWEDGQVATLGGFGGLTPNGIRIGPIYTPPDLRRRGYASALTAELTQMLLGRGRRFCFLYTDLANPTSNSIYHRIGYEPVSDVDMWSFG